MMTANDILSSLCAGGATGQGVILNRKELDALARDTGMKHWTGWGGWHLVYRRISPGIFEVRFGERFSSVQG